MSESDPREPATRDGVRAGLGPMKSYYFPGEPVDVPFTLSGLRGPRRLRFDQEGYISSLSLNVVDRQGKATFFGPTIPRGEGPGRSDDHQFKDRLDHHPSGPDDLLLFNFSFDQHPGPSQAGDYRVQVPSGTNELLAEAKFRVVAAETMQAIRASAFCGRPESRDDRFAIDGSGKVGYELAVVKAATDEGPAWFCITSDVRYWHREFEQVRSLTWLKTPTPADARVAKQALDHRWRLWVLLEAGRNRSLVVFDLLSRDVRTVVPWTSKSIAPWAAEPIELSATRAVTEQPFLFVVAGLTDRPRVTTSSYDADDFLEPNDADQR